METAKGANRKIKNQAEYSGPSWNLARNTSEIVWGKSYIALSFLSKKFPKQFSKKYIIISFKGFTARIATWIFESTWRSSCIPMEGSWVQWKIKQHCMGEKYNKFHISTCPFHCYLLL